MNSELKTGQIAGRNMSIASRKHSLAVLKKNRQANVRITGRNRKYCGPQIKTIFCQI